MKTLINMLNEGLSGNLHSIKDSLEKSHRTLKNGSKYKQFDTLIRQVFKHLKMDGIFDEKGNTTLTQNHVDSHYNVLELAKLLELMQGDPIKNIEKVMGVNLNLAKDWFVSFVNGSKGEFNISISGVIVSDDDYYKLEKGVRKLYGDLVDTGIQGSNTIVDIKLSY